MSRIHGVFNASPTLSSNCGWSHAFRQLLTKSILLSVFGSILGLILGYAGIRALFTGSLAGLPRIGERGAAVGVDWRVLAFTLGIALPTGILFGLFPALGASRPDLNTTLKESSNRSGTGFGQSKARSLLVIREVSLALVLLVGAALLIRTFIALRELNPGFDPRKVFTLEMSLTGDQFKKTAGVAEVDHDGPERLKRTQEMGIPAQTAQPSANSSSGTACGWTWLASRLVSARPSGLPASLPAFCSASRPGSPWFLYPFRSY